MRRPGALRLVIRQSVEGNGWMNGWLEGGRERCVLLMLMLQE